MAGKARVTLLTSDFDYQLPPDLIAQSPAERREDSRLLVLDRRKGEISHDVFSSLPCRLSPGDLVVANRSRVIPARLRARRETGGVVEILLLRRQAPTAWTALVRPSRKIRPGCRLSFPGSAVEAVADTDLGDGEWLIIFSNAADFDAELHRIGSVPLPPYIHNGHTPAERYQTVYADREGSVAAPTAGLHFSDEVIRQLRRRGIAFELVTLHVGPGTFRPVAAARVTDHHMDSEWGEVSESVSDSINQVKTEGGKIVAVGTTTTRLLEAAGSAGMVRPFAGEADCFVLPGYRFGVVEALVTNFHLPRSTLLMLVSAFAGRELILEAYREAIRLRYRFYSFGDAMLIV
jgi:S-adenosylmethionine:tRNA ribosyltransferase-isomerase